MIRFFVYSNLKNWLQDGDPKKDIGSVRTFIIGGIAGAASVFGNTPVDVVKTRMQVLCYLIDIPVLYLLIYSFWFSRVQSLTNIRILQIVFYELPSMKVQKRKYLTTLYSSLNDANSNRFLFTFSKQLLVIKRQVSLNLFHADHLCGNCKLLT